MVDFQSRDTRRGPEQSDDGDDSVADETDDDSAFDRQSVTVTEEYDERAVTYAVMTA